jgi:flagellar assembly protein FliH
MRWRKSITPGSSLRQVRLISPSDKDSSEVGSARQGQAAYERGLAEGEKRLGEQLLLQRSELQQVQNGVLASLRQAVPQVVRQTESTVVQLALEVARKLVDGLPISAEMVEASVRSALAQVEDSAEFDIYLHAEDLALLQRCNSPMLLPGPGHEAMEFHTSPEVTRGGCLVRTHFGVVDARRETKMDLIRHSLEA